MKAKSEAYQKNIEKRGKVPSSLTVDIEIYNKYRKKKINFQLDQSYVDSSFSSV